MLTDDPARQLYATDLNTPAGGSSVTTATFEEDDVDRQTAISEDTFSSPRNLTISPETVSTLDSATKEGGVTTPVVVLNQISTSSFTSNPASVPASVVSLIPTEEDDFNNPEISTYIKVFVRHSYVMTLLNVALAIVCTIFALPYVNLSTPNAGLRLRWDPIGDRADGFFAAALEMLAMQQSNSASLQSSSILSSSGSSATTSAIQMYGLKQSEKASLGSASIATYERTQDANWMCLIWFTADGSDVFTEANVEYMAQFEARLFNLTTYQQQLCKLDLNGNCIPFESPISELLRPDRVHLPMSQRVRMLDIEFLPKDFDTNNHTCRYTRTWVPIGAPWPGYASFADRPDEQQAQMYEAMKKELLPMIMDRAFHSGDAPPKLTYFHPYVQDKQSMDILAQDMAYSILAVSLIFACLLWHMRSLFLAGGALLQIIVSFPISLFIYRMVLDVKLFAGLHAIGVFLILGIGVDDCFVFFDSLDQANRQFPSRSQVFRMDRAYRAARFAMFSTSFTTCICFLSMVSCGIPVLKYFGIFCAFLVALNYVLVMTLFAGLLLIWDLKLRPKPGKPGVIQRFKTFVKSIVRKLTSRCVPDDVMTKTSARIKPLTTRRRSSTTGSLAKNPHSSCPERVFIFLAEEVVTTTWGKTMIIGFSLVVITVLAYFATQLKPSSTIDSFWPKGHPFRWYEELSAEGFYGDETETAVMRFVDGMKPPCRKDFDYANDQDMGTPVYDDQFDIANVNVQLFITQQCDYIRSRLGVDPLLYSKDNSSLCPMNDFRDWLVSKGRTFPISSPYLFAAAMLEFFYQPYNQAAGGAIGFKPMQFGTDQFILLPKFIFNQFPTTRSQRGDSYEERLAVYDTWNQFSNKYPVDGLGSYGSVAPVDGFYEVWMRTQQILLQNAYQSIAFSIGVAFGVLYVATHGDVLSAAVGTFTLGASVSATLGIMFLAGWSLGAVEAVACTILCGIAIDYSIHMSIAHSETFFEDEVMSRNERVIEALRKLGVSVLYGGLTTLLASCVLMMCTLSILTRFGQFMVMVIVFALVFALFLQMAMLSLPIPSRPLMLKKGTTEHKFGNSARKAASPFSVSERVCFAIWVLIMLGLIGGAAAIGITYQIKSQAQAIQQAAQKAAQNLADSGRRLDSSATLVQQPGLESLPLFAYSDSNLDSLPVGIWSEVRVRQDDVGFPTGCAAHGEDYSFFVYRGADTNSSAVYIELEGRGGAVCYDRNSCNQAFLTKTIDRTRFNNINAKEDSFPFLLDRKPRLEIYFPYCTADAFLGNITANYYTSANPEISKYFDFRHLGQGNLRAGMEWLFNQISDSNNNLADSNFVMQGCGTGGVGALAASSWSVPAFKERFNITSVSLIVDSASLVFNQSVVDSSIKNLAEEHWNSDFAAALSFIRANNTMNGRMLVASSTYDWYQTAIGGFQRASRSFKSAVETQSEVWPYLLRTNGDRHCVVLNPVKDRADTNQHIVDAVTAFVEGGDWLNTDETNFKCAGSECDFDADLRYA